MSLEFSSSFPFCSYWKFNFFKNAPICQVHYMVKKCMESYKKKNLSHFWKQFEVLRTKKLPQNSSNSEVSCSAQWSFPDLAAPWSFSWSLLLLEAQVASADQRVCHTCHIKYNSSITCCCSAVLWLSCAGISLALMEVHLAPSCHSNIKSYIASIRHTSWDFRRLPEDADGNYYGKCNYISNIQYQIPSKLAV